MPAFGVALSPVSGQEQHHQHGDQRPALALLIGKPVGVPGQHEEAGGRSQQAPCGPAAGGEPRAEERQQQVRARHQAQGERALEGEEPILVAVGAAKIDLLRQALDRDAGDVQFAFQRLCDPKVESPIFSNLADYVIGMNDAYETAQKNGGRFDYSKPVRGATLKTP